MVIIEGNVNLLLVLRAFIVIPIERCQNRVVDKARVDELGLARGGPNLDLGVVRLQVRSPV